MNVVMDTNVAIVANRKSDQANETCVQACIQELARIRDERCCLVMDLNRQIFDEYKEHLNFSGQPGPGDVFFKWVFDNQTISWVQINEDDHRVYQEFPKDPQLEAFDRSDRKFVAVARAASEENPPLILNASDTDWWHHRLAFKKHNIRIKFLCCELMNKESRQKRKMTS